MSREGTLDQESLRIRLAKLDYRIPNMEDDEIIAEVERIYLEETGTPLDANIDIFHMKKGKDNHEYLTDADGTAFRFTDKESGKTKEDIYIVPRGTVTNEDWAYNLFGIGTGSGGMAQAIDTDVFIEETLDQFLPSDDAKIYGIGHSQANNHLINVQLDREHFDEIYTYNGAQTSVYQLLEEDMNFERLVRRHFNITATDQNSFRSINPSELEAFAIDYYEDRTDNVHQTRSVSDILYSADHVPGFIELGNVTTVRTDHENEGFSNVIQSVSVEQLLALGEMLEPFGEVYKEGGTESVQEKAIEQALEHYHNIHETNIDFDMLKDTSVTIVEELQEAGYLSKEDAAEAKEHLTEILSKLDRVYESASLRSAWANSIFGRRSQKYIGDFVEGGYLYFFSDLDERIARLGDIFYEIIDPIEEHHKLSALLNELSDDGKEYYNNQLYLTVENGSGKDIRLNLSATLDAYSNGMRYLDTQKEQLTRYLEVAEREYVEDFELRKGAIIRSMNIRESSPRSFKHMLPNSTNSHIISLQFRESFPPLVDVPVDGITLLVNQQQEELRHAISEMKEGVEKLFDEDFNVSQMFKHLGG